MTAIINNSDYYRGNYNTYALNSLIAKAGGNNLHLTLLNILLSPTFINKIDKEIYHDCRASLVASCIFPIDIQIPLVILTYIKELQLIEYFDKEKLAANIIEPITFIELVNSIDNKVIGGYWYQLLSNLTQENLRKIEELLGLEQLTFDETDISKAIIKVLTYKGLSADLAETFNSIYKENDRKRAAVLVGNWLGYPSLIVNSLVEQAELWEYRTSYI